MLVIQYKEKLDAPVIVQTPDGQTLKIKYCKRNGQPCLVFDGPEHFQVKSQLVGMKLGSEIMEKFKND